MLELNTKAQDLEFRRRVEEANVQRVHTQNLTKEKWERETQ